MSKLYIVLRSDEAGRIFRSKKEALDNAENHVGIDAQPRFVAKVLWTVEQSIVHVRSVELDEEKGILEGVVEGEEDDQEEPHSSPEEA